MAKLRAEKKGAASGEARIERNESNARNARRLKLQWVSRVYSTRGHNGGGCER